MGMAANAASKLGTLNPFSSKGRARAQGLRQTGKTANTLWKYYQQQLGQQGEEANTENIKNFFMQKPYNVDASVIDAALKAAGVTESVSEENDEEFYSRDNWADTFPDEEQPQQGPQPLSDKQVEQIFNYVVGKAPQNFASGDKGSIPSDVIDAVKKLKPAQKQALGKTLLGQQTNV